MYYVKCNINASQRRGRPTLPCIPASQRTHRVKTKNDNCNASDAAVWQLQIIIADATGEAADNALPLCGARGEVLINADLVDAYCI